MAINPEGSFSAELGNRYRELLARDGVELRLVPSTGAVESMARLRNPTSGISIAIIPGGIGNHQEPPGLVSLGAISATEFEFGCISQLTIGKLGVNCQTASVAKSGCD
jgi:hypothetical protein